MKEIKYIYVNHSPLFATCHPESLGHVIITRGDIVTLMDNGRYSLNDKFVVDISPRSISEFFEPYQEDDGANNYNELRNKIAENVMCSILSDFEGCQKRYNFRHKNIPPMELIADISLSYANALVKEMIKHPFVNDIKNEKSETAKKD